jgi:hypothetical protein
MQMYSGRHVVDNDFQPLDLKSDCKEGGILGTEVKNLNLHIFTTQTFPYLYGWNVASETSTKTILFPRNKIYTYSMCPFPIPISSGLKSDRKEGGILGAEV